MENLTRERAHDLCVEMWNEMIENMYYAKINSALIKKYAPEDDCFACEYYGGFSCRGCPFEVSFGSVGCASSSSPYDKWWKASNVQNSDRDKKVKQHAIAIADLFIE